MIARIDTRYADSYSATVRGEFTSDGTEHGPGRGRVLASREPCMIDCVFYSGWLVEP
jgi:hypothetical protein